jgi:hypothetical protein
MMNRTELDRYENISSQDLARTENRMTFGMGIKIFLYWDIKCQKRIRNKKSWRRH